MKLSTTPRVSDRLTQQELARHAQQGNALAEGRISAIYNALPSAPTTGSYAQGDFIRNSAPAELGSAPNKYVVFGWVCVSGGTPGTWQQCRFLTGN